MGVLMEIFPSHETTLCGDVMWPARLPDLTPSDYFLWGCLKAEVYQHRPTSIDGLKSAIRLTVKEIPQEMIRRVVKNFRNRPQQCIKSRRRHLNDVIFKR